MAKRSPEFFICFLIVGLCVMFSGCGTSSKTCGDCSERLLLYATTTSNQILGFSIAPTGALTPIAPSARPPNSQSIAGTYEALLFADNSSNEAVGESVDLGTGALTPVPGSPFTLGSTSGGPKPKAQNACSPRRSVARAVAGYIYSANWAICTSGTLTR
jgi:hypothetical protein